MTRDRGEDDLRNLRSRVGDYLPDHAASELPGAAPVVRALLVVISMKPSPTRIVVVALVALGATACGGVALRVGDGGANGGQGGSGQGGTGQGGGGGSVLDCGPNGTETLYLPGCDGGLLPYVRCVSTALPPSRVCPAPICNGLDEATCTATPGCQAQRCEVCPGAAPTYAGCTTPGASVACPGETCIQQTCGSLDETSCKTRGDCSAAYCPDCKGGQSFVGCDSPAEGATVCAGGCPSPPTCNGLDETSCMARSDCRVGSCRACDGEVGFVGCLGLGEPLPECPLVCPSGSCSGLGETACKGTNDCTPRYCPNCPGGQTYESCVGVGDLVPACPLACPVPAPCASVTIPAECDSRTDCHSVFVSNANADCVVNGGCTFFTHCAEGGKASCTGTPACQIRAPFCEAPAYVVSYTADCFEGCVRASECPP
jgi:hypothetical protein